MRRFESELGALRHHRGPNARAIIHCTHGMNRTGFLIVHALCRLHNMPLRAALDAFAAVRPPGLWRQEYAPALVRVRVRPVAPGVRPRPG